MNFNCSNFWGVNFCTMSRYYLVCDFIQKFALRPPMLDEAIQDEAAYAGRGSNAG